MSFYINSIKEAMYLFPMIAVLLTIPYVLLQNWRKRKITAWESVVLYSFAFYLLCAYFLVILPTSPVNTGMGDASLIIQLMPFQFVVDFIRETKLIVSDSTTWLPAIFQGCFLQVLFNILLMIPFGAFLNFFFGHPFRQAVLTSFCLSLFFELTQLSGLYGFYPVGYRLFDVDDLLLNVVGGMLGYMFASGLIKANSTICTIVQPNPYAYRNHAFGDIK